MEKRVYSPPKVQVVDLELQGLCIVYSELHTGGTVDSFDAPPSRGYDWEEYEK